MTETLTFVQSLLVSNDIPLKAKKFTYKRRGMLFNKSTWLAKSNNGYSNNVFENIGAVSSLETVAWKN